MQEYSFSVIASGALKINAEDSISAEKQAEALAALRLRNTGFAMEDMELDKVKPLDSNAVPGPCDMMPGARARFYETHGEPYTTPAETAGHPDVSG